MRKIFWENPYQSQLHTCVIEVAGNRVAFAETIVFSFSGGQESDKAYINTLPIIDSKIEGKIIYYSLPDNHGLSIGDQVLMEIDWPRRYKLMRYHFAAELILELVTRILSIKKIGAHIAEDKARIDFLYENNIATHLAEILTEYNKIIAKDIPIKTGYSDIENQKRYWEIEGFARVPCGGTHVKSTAEVGPITLKRINLGKGKERIEIRLIESHDLQPF